MDRGNTNGKANDIRQLQFSPDGKLLAANAGNPKMYSHEDWDQLLNPDTEGEQIYVWDPETGEANYQVRRVEACLFSRQSAVGRYIS